jgi:DNA-binding MarR family transcriptional regulator
VATHRDDEISIPALLRAARGSYADAIRAALGRAGFEDLPRNGPFLLGGMANQRGTAVELVRTLGVSRQAASQLIDVLVLRGYLARETNADDRRRMDIELSARGRAAAEAVADGIEQVDGELARVCSRTQLAGLRAGLLALAAMGHGGEPD